jgi:TRAP transporter TAXI family solute receptor
MFLRRDIIAVLLALITTAFAAGAEVRAQDFQLFRIGTGGIGGTYYPIGGLIAQSISSPPGARPCDQGGSCGVAGLVAVAQSANGSVANIDAIAKGSLESGFAQSDIAFWAYSGTGIYSDQNPVTSLRAIANLYLESIHLVARKDAGISSVDDLKGKRVSLDEPGSGTLVDAQLILAAYGLSEQDLVPRYVKPSPAAAMIGSGELDAFFIVAGYPTDSVATLASTVGAELIPIRGPKRDALIAQFDFFAKDVIPEGTYSGIGETETLSVGAQWLVSAHVSDDLVYEITKALWSDASRKLFEVGHLKAKAITLETALEGISIPLHAGAARYYREVGIMK